MTANQNNVRVGFGHASSDGPDAGLGYELHADAGAGVHLLQVVDELGQILDRINVVVRRGADQLDTGLSAAQAGNDALHLHAGKLAAFAGLGALGHLDFQFLGAGKIFRCHAETAAGDLLDLAIAPIAIWIAFEARRILTAFAGIGLAANFIHSDGQQFMGLRAEGP